MRKIKCPFCGNRLVMMQRVYGHTHTSINDDGTLDRTNEDFDGESGEITIHCSECEEELTDMFDFNPDEDKIVFDVEERLSETMSRPKKE